jgi:hypothetical protein
MCSCLKCVTECHKIYINAIMSQDSKNVTLAHDVQRKNWIAMGIWVASQIVFYYVLWITNYQKLKTPVLERQKNFVIETLKLFRRITSTTQFRDKEELYHIFIK